MYSNTLDALSEASLQQLLHSLSDEKRSFFQAAFQQFDVDHSGTLDASELKEVMRSMGRPASDQQIQAAVATLTGTSNHAVITFEQFAALMQIDLLGTPEASSPLPSTQALPILYFIDVLCIWSYIAQIRVDELKSTFGSQVEINYHFVSVFGDAHRKLEKRWHDRGGFEGYSKHVKGVVAKFNHLTIHPDVWTKTIPQSSTSCHLFLRAIALLENQEPTGTESFCEQAIAALRKAFFQDLKDVSDRRVQFEIAEALCLPIDQLEAHINSGAAYAELSRDFELVKEHNVTVSPTMIFNEGRQRLNGNVGYRVIEANIRELIHSVPSEASWC